MLFLFSTLITGYKCSLPVAWPYSGTSSLQLNSNNFKILQPVSETMKYKILYNFISYNFIFYKVLKHFNKFILKFNLIKSWLGNKL